MRFKLGYGLLLTVVAVYCVYLGFSRDLDYYMHPRYERFTIVMSITAVLLCTLNAVLKGRTQRTSHHHKESLLSMVPLFIMIALALLLPARSLKAVTVAQRATDAQTASGTDVRSQRTVFTGSSRGLSIVDWAQLIGSNTDETYYANKPAKVSGFLYDADLGGDTVWVARFAVTCCAVDARPVGIPVRVENWNATYEEDQWLEVEGTFRMQQTAQGAQLVLMPTNVGKIEEPQNPYVN